MQNQNKIIDNFDFSPFHFNITLSIKAIKSIYLLIAFQTTNTPNYKQLVLYFCFLNIESKYISPIHWTNSKICKKVCWVQKSKKNDIFIQQQCISVATKILQSVYLTITRNLYLTRQKSKTPVLENTNIYVGATIHPIIS